MTQMSEVAAFSCLYKCKEIGYFVICVSRACPKLDPVIYNIHTYTSKGNSYSSKALHMPITLRCHWYNYVLINSVIFHALSFFVTIFLPSFLFAACSFIPSFTSVFLFSPCTSPVLPVNDFISPLAASLPVSGFTPCWPLPIFSFGRERPLEKDAMSVRNDERARKQTHFQTWNLHMTLNALSVVVFYWSSQTIFFRSVHADRLWFKMGSMKDVNLKSLKSEG